MKEIREYIPKNKFDTELISELSQMQYPFYKPILFELFEWIQDCNWPVAKEIIPLLINAGEDVVPVVQEILKTNDEVWKYWVLSQVVAKMDKTIIFFLKDELTRIAEKPTDGEKNDEVDIVASEILENL